ncbi:MAG: prolyl oligopeptidase family serine peptidase [Terriglobia bacterium]
MRRMPVFLAVFVLLATPRFSLGQKAVVETPSEADIPKPVPAQVSLAGSAQPDITRFLNIRRAFSPSLSPDGSRLSFRTSITGKPQLWVVEARGGWPDQLTFGESATFNEWSPAGDWIAYGTDRSGNEREGFYLIAPAGNKEKELLAPSEAFREFGGFSPDGKRIAYATTERNGIDFDIHVLDLETGEDRKVYQGKGGLYVAAWRPDGKALVLSETRGEDANNVYLLELPSGSLTPLFQPEVAAAYSGFAWKRDGSGFYVATDQDRDFSGLAFFDVSGKKLTFLETPAHDVEQVSMSRDGRYLAWTTNEGGYSTLHVRDLEKNERVTLPDLPPGIYFLEWASRAPVAAIAIFGPRVPGDVWTWDARTGALHRATRSSTAGLDLDSLIVPQHVDFPARDGETLHGLFYLPRRVKAGKRPPVLLGVHGGPTAQARPFFNPAHQYLLARGIAVFDLNFRGSTGYGKRFARLDNQRLRPNAVRDMEDAVEWLAKDNRVDASRTAVMGGSYGGYMTLAAVTTFPDLFRAGVSFVGVSNWITALEGASPQLKASDRIEYGDIDDPDDREFFRQLSPLTHVDRVGTPSMIIHGANDPRDPVAESDQFVRAVRAQGGEVEYLRFPDEGHGIRKLSNRITAYRRIAAFLERLLEVPAAEE